MSQHKKRSILYIDMDNTLVDFEWGIGQLSAEDRERYKDNYDEIPGFFSDLPPIEGAIEAYNRLSVVFDTYILSTAPWENPTAWADKVRWVHRHLPDTGYKRLILSHNKHLNRGDYLIDDRIKHGADRFEGDHIQIGSEEYPDWKAVLNYLI
ncbi:MAG: hypothetical protein R3211_06860 [Balneolaceae bacterium]|nr:hypothetical protein [Balneolaceae bacterium]